VMAYPTYPASESADRIAETEFLTAIPAILPETIAALTPTAAPLTDPVAIVAAASAIGIVNGLAATALAVAIAVLTARCAKGAARPTA